MPAVVLYNFPPMCGRSGMTIQNTIDEVIAHADENGNVDCANLSLEWNCLDCKFRTFVHLSMLEHSTFQHQYHTRWQRIVRWLKIYCTWS